MPKYCCDFGDIIDFQKFPYKLLYIFILKSYGNKLFRIILKMRALSSRVIFQNIF